MVIRTTSDSPTFSAPNYYPENEILFLASHNQFDTLIPIIENLEDDEKISYVETIILNYLEKN